MTVDLHADNAAIVFVNGVEIGRTWFSPASNFTGPPETFSTSDSALFHAGVNLLEIHLVDVGGVAGLDYKADVSFTPLPDSKSQCVKGGWESYGIFKNQGDCVSFVATVGKNPPAN